MKSQIGRIGVTGGIGSGKTTVCGMFERLGAPVISADLIAREISDSDPKVKRAISSLLGAESYRSEGTLNRPYVASRVFSKKPLQQKLNAIVHPEVEKEIERQFQRLTRVNVRFAMVEAALIFEAGLNRILDSVIVVDAGERARLQRVVKRDHVSAEEVRKRMDAQWSQELKIQRADYIIGNNGSMHDLETKVTFLFNLLTQLYQ